MLGWTLSKDRAEFKRKRLQRPPSAPRYSVQVARAHALSALTVALPLLAAAAAGFVDPKLCAGCHRQIADNYARTGMGRSFYRPSAATLPDPPRDFYHDRSDTHYAVSQRDGAWYQRRWQIGFGGKEANVEELRIDYVMGSGNHARSFLHRTGRGLLIELPFGWYSGANSPRGGHGTCRPAPIPIIR